jgi:hypothetical protein
MLFEPNRYAQPYLKLRQWRVYSLLPVSHKLPAPEALTGYSITEIKRKLLKFALTD